MKEQRPRSAKQERFRARYGPWAVVTGASSGIGRELARRLAAAGVNLVLVARNETNLEQLAAGLRARESVETRVLVVDLAQPGSIDALNAATRDLDVGLLVAAAGFGTSGPFLESPVERELEMLEVNCRAVVTLTWHFGHRLAERGQGGIILLSSIVGFQGMPNAAHYAATKAYVLTLAEALHVELAASGFDVLGAAPGPMRSGFAERAGMQMGAALDPAAIAQPTLDALGQRATVLPGFLSKLLVYSLAPLPRSVRVRIMGQVMAGMTKQRTGRPAAAK